MGAWPPTRPWWRLPPPRRGRWAPGGAEPAGAGAGSGRAEQIDAVGHHAIGAEPDQPLGGPLIVDGVAERTQAGGPDLADGAGVPQRVLAHHGHAAELARLLQPTVAQR